MTAFSRLHLCSRFAPLFLLAAAAASCASVPIVVTDHTDYNVNDEVQLRVKPAPNATAAIRYAGQSSALASGIRLNGSSYQPLWKIPPTTLTGRYYVDLTFANGQHIPQATSFAVHRQLAKVMAVDLDKTFYRDGDKINPRIVVKNLSDQPITDLQVEFEPYNYPWIAPEAGDPPLWKHIVAQSLTLSPGEERQFNVTNATTAQVEHNQPEALYYCVVLRDHKHPDRIYDLAFALPAFTSPPNMSFPKQYPFPYLYWHEAEVPKSQSYRNFYPPEFVSDVIRFDTRHTMFAAGSQAELPFDIHAHPEASWQYVRLHTRVTNSQGREVAQAAVPGPLPASYTFRSPSLEPGVYTLQVSIETPSGAVLASNQLEYAINKLPESILIFCAHSDDDTAHPGLIRAAAENHIPIHFVYLTGSDTGGCDRFYMHSCDAERAMDFGEVRLGELRASLAHLGIASDAISLLGLPDGGLEEIWYRHPHASNPYLSVLLASDHSPYLESAVPNLAYAADPVVAAIKSFIIRDHPDLIVTGHPDERHVDHRTGNWLVVKAMQQLLEEGKLSRDTELLTDVSYGPVSGRHAPYKYAKDTFYVSGEAAKLGQEALWYYQSQDGNHQQAEIKDFKALPRTEPFSHYRILDWWEHRGWNATPPRGQ